MKKYNNFLITETNKKTIIDNKNNFYIKELSYYDIINLCELNMIDIDSMYKDRWNFGYCDYINNFKNNRSIYSDKNYHFLVGIKDNKLVSLFYKYVNSDKNFYGDGYIISTEKGTANKMFLEMKKIDGFTTFSNLENISSIKSQLKLNAEILSLSSSPPKSKNDFFDKNILDESILQMIKDEKIYYKDTYTGNIFKFVNEKGDIDLKTLSYYLTINENIKLIFPKNTFGVGVDGIEETGLKLYFYHKKK